MTSLATTRLTTLTQYCCDVDAGAAATDGGGCGSVGDDATNWSAAAAAAVVAL